MSHRRRWLLVPVALGGTLVTAVLIAVVALLVFPDLVRLAVTARLRAVTGRPVAIEALSIDPWTGRLALRGLRVTDHDGGVLATLDRLDARVRRRSLLRGHISIERLALEGSSVRVVRDGAGEFNIADLISHKPGGGRTLDITVDEFTLAHGTVLLEDRMLSPWRTWRSEDLTFRAANLSTRHAHGTAEATSTINGSPVSVRIEEMRLAPVHLKAVVRAQNVDLALARVYLPPDVPVTLERGRLDLTVTAVNDAREGLRLDADATIADAVAIRTVQRDAFLRAPALRLAVRDLTASERGLAVGRVEIDGRATVLHGDVDPPARFELDRVRASAEGLSWPVQGPARVSLASTVPGGGELRADGVVHLRPTVAELDVRLEQLSLEPWARYVSGSARASGTGEARLAVRANLQGGISATATGTAAVTRLAVTDGGRRLLAAERAEVSGIDAGWPARLTIGRVLVRRPAVSLERDAAGAIALPARATSRPAQAPGEEEAMSARPTARVTPPITVRQIVVEGGALDWRDAAVAPPARLELRAIDLGAQDVVWPLRGPIPVQLRMRTPGTGTLAVNGSVTAEPLGADVRVRAQGVELAPYRPYLAMAGAVTGQVDGDLHARVARGTTLETEVRGDATLRRVALNEGRRRIASVERAEARGLDVAWPSRAVADRVTLRQPWVLVERDANGAFPLRSLVTPESKDAAPALPSDANTTPGTEAPARTLAVRRLVIEDGGARFVDHSISPPYAEDLSGTWATVTGVATAPAPPARVEARGVLGSAGRVVVRAQVAALGAPVFIESTTELRDFPVPRTNPYLQHFTAWTARQGRLGMVVKGRISGDELQVSSQTQLGRLQVVRVAPDDAAEKRVGLPLGMIVALLKDRDGNISLSLPIGGRLSDPKFDFHDAIWTALRTLTVKTIALPVSWIGRLRFTPDSRIADIEVDPVGFEPGSVELAATAAERVAALASFMKKLPDVRMVVTSAVSVGDIEALKAEQIRTRIRELAAQQRLPELDAAARLYAEHYRASEAPEDMDTIVTALREVEPAPTDGAYRLAKRRAEVVRDALKKTEIDPERLQLNKEPGALDTPDGGRLDFSLTDRVKPRRTLADLLRALAQALTQRLSALKR